jgi:hypothetical protein
VDSPQAWIPQENQNDLLIDEPQEYSPPTLDEIWFKLPANSTNWNHLVHIPSSAGINAESLSYSADCYLPETYSWNPELPAESSGPSSSTPSLPLHKLSPSDTLKSPSFSFPLLTPRNFDIETELSRQNLYKTELCRSWVESASCKYGNKCQFAHGQHELRPVIRHPKYKTEICKTFHTNGTCPYGRRCRFVHNPAELREGLDLLPQNDSETPEEVELRELQERFKLANLAPDPVFYPTPQPAGPFTSLSADSSPSVPSKKGSSLPFFQKLRKQKF